MNKSKYLILGLFLIVVSQAHPVAAIICKPAVQTPAYKVWQVTELKQEGVSLPDRPIQKTWKYNISWKPALTKPGGTLVKTYKLKAYGCTGYKQACTDARCNAEISGCGLGTSWAGVTADFGISVAGVRLAVIYKPGVCD
ncbi:MAG TPA: hypothetical protein VIV15_04720 [Anaerolineales bacterium]